MIQADFAEIFNADYCLKGKWGEEFFGNQNPIVLELGCGKGEYTVELARKFPEKNFIGIDIKGARMWRGAKTATEEGLKNVAFVRTRIEFIGSFFANSEVSELWITFADPRLKSSQAHRRLTSAQFLTRYATFMADNGMINLKTDSAHLHHYTRHIIEQNNLPTIECIEDIYALDPIPELLQIQTTYEKRFIAEGLPITYLSFSLGGRKEFTADEFWGDKQEQDLDYLRTRRTKIEIDPRSGFCFGVVRAIEAAESFLATSGGGYCLGEIVHNRKETERLELKGLKIITHDDLERLPQGSTVLIRAHGEPPSTFERTSALGLKLVDATCPVVASLQRRVRAAWEAMQSVDGQVVLLGKRGHSEVVGLTGQVAGDVIVVEGVADLDSIDFARPITMLSQTTQSLELFEIIKEEIICRAINRSTVTIHDTICRQVVGRNPHLAQFAERFDTIIFVSGRHSSNGQALHEICRKANARTHFVESDDEIELQWIEGCQSIGICGATSTPLWLMQKISKKIDQIICDSKK